MPTNRRRRARLKVATNPDLESRLLAGDVPIGMKFFGEGSPEDWRTVDRVLEQLGEVPDGMSRTDKIRTLWSITGRKRSTPDE